MHRFGNTIATTHFGHKGSRKTDNKLPALLYSTVHPDPLLTQDLWGDLERQRKKRNKGRDKNNQWELSFTVLWCSSWLGAAKRCCSWSKAELCQQLCSGRFPSPVPHVPSLSVRSDNCRRGSPQTNSLNSHLPHVRTLPVTTESNADHSAFHPVFTDLALNPLCYSTSVRYG